MSYRIELESRARREYLGLEGEIRRRIEDSIDDLSRDPRPPGAKKLVGKGGYRIRKGDYRILYLVDDSAMLVRVYRVGHRREIYRRT